MKDPASSPFTSSPANSRRRRRSRSFNSSSSSLSFSPATTPSPTATPAHNLLSIIPFSWEHQPGVPKSSTITAASHPADPLPLPPPIRSAAVQRRRSAPTATPPDPFAIAMAECAKDPDRADGLDMMWKPATVGRRGAVAAALGARFGLVELYGSCKTSCTVANSTVRIPRSGQPGGSYGLLLNRRAG